MGQDHGHGPIGPQGKAQFLIGEPSDEGPQPFTFPGILSSLNFTKIKVFVQKNTC